MNGNMCVRRELIGLNDRPAGEWPCKISLHSDVVHSGERETGIANRFIQVPMNMNYVVCMQMTIDIGWHTRRVIGETDSVSLVRNEY